MYRSFGIFRTLRRTVRGGGLPFTHAIFRAERPYRRPESRRYAPFRTCPAAGVELRNRPSTSWSGEAGAFAYRGEQAHDGYYSMTYHPKSGRAADADRRGKSMIVTGGDRITLTGTAEAIYYCTLGGGIYDDPALSELLYVADSLGRIRSGYSENARAAFARGDQAEGRRWNELFNRFYADDRAPHANVH